MPVQWTPDLAVGVDLIDDQHKELFKRVNALLEAMSQGKGKEALGPTAAFLGEYVKSHFAMEERNMTRFSYPEYATHRRLHTEFIDEFALIKKRIDEQGVDTRLVLQVQQRLNAWLRDHIGKVDRKLGAFLKDKL